MKCLFFLFSLLTISSCVNSDDHSSITNKKNGCVKLLWEDNFEGKSLDQSKWNIYSGNGCPEICGFGNNELQYYSDDVKNISVDSGQLIITATFDSNFTSSKITTSGKLDINKGYLEISAKLPVSIGSWPAIWLLPTLDRPLNWPMDGEIDVMENVGYNPGIVYGTIHTKAYNHINGTEKSDSVFVKDAHSNFHIYGLNWTDSTLEWYVDEKLFNKVNRLKSDGLEQWPFEEEYHLIINQAVGGDWGGRFGIDTSSYPQKFCIDYVRYYNFKPTK